MCARQTRRECRKFPALSWVRDSWRPALLGTLIPDAMPNVTAAKAAKATCANIAEKVSVLFRS
jgi:hypothetical protein